MSAETERALKELLHAVREDIAELKEMLTGNGTPSKGLVVRVDRLEQSEARRIWLSRTTLGASIFAVAAIVKGWISGR